jgi:septum formation protein
VPPKLILASASPRRREMLAGLGVEYEAVATAVEELTAGAAPEELVVENARRKAVVGLRLAADPPGSVALGVDTEVVLDGRLLGKAVREEEARERLAALSGRTHEVLSGVCLVSGDRVWGSTGSAGTSPHSTPEEAERVGVARSLVTFIDLKDRTLERYIASGEWRDRAGAYAIQGLGSTLVARLEGDFSNVVGLPLQLLLELAPELFPAVSRQSSA